MGPLKLYLFDGDWTGARIVVARDRAEAKKLMAKETATGYPIDVDPDLLEEYDIEAGTIIDTVGDK